MHLRHWLGCGLLLVGMSGLSACGSSGNGGAGGGSSDVGSGTPGAGSGGGTGTGDGAGSGSGGDGSATCSTGTGSGEIRVVNAIALSQLIEVKVPSTSVDFGELSFGSASGFLDAPVCSYKIPVKVTDASGAQTLYVPDVSITADAQTTLFATGVDVADEDSVGFAVVKPLATVPAGQIEIQLIHVASASPSFNVYALPPEATRLSEGLQLAEAYGEQGFQRTAYSVPENIPAGTYRFVLTKVDGEQVYESGPIGIGLPTANGASSYQLAVLDAPDAPDGSSISLLLLDETGAQTALGNGKH